MRVFFTRKWAALAMGLMTLPQFVVCVSPFDVDGDDIEDFFDDLDIDFDDDCCDDFFFDFEYWW